MIRYNNDQEHAIMGNATQFLTWPNSQQFFSLFTPVTLYPARSPPNFACAPVTLPTEPHAKPQAPRTSPARDHMLTNQWDYGKF